ncbi:MAG: Metalloprotease MmpA [Alphaproteobacteria bacterium MarineAlpha3_Bin5]|nr:RIP metalloprotease RseP [Magnetovibrio sp.]PPR76532.1 MAG: Metalloprotease MmpA [Alphaproteobacteria bacterium MarineAlpha3_Bin5]
MESFLNFTWYNIIVFLIVFSIVVFVHEWGHFWVARRNKVRVEVFSIGFGPEVFGWTDSLNTRWKLSAIPLGGYVKMFGERSDNDSPDQPPEEETPPEEKAVSFQYKTVGQRSAIVAAGPIVNLLFAVVLMGGIAMFVGVPNFMVGVGAVLENSAAQKAGLKEGDIILSIAEKEIKNPQDVKDIVTRNPGVSMLAVIERNGSILKKSVRPDLYIADERNVGRLGIHMQAVNVSYERRGPIGAIWYGTQYTVNMITRIFDYLGDLVLGRRDANELGGPLGIAQITGQAAKQGLLEVIVLTAALSINLGLLNLFPIPILDGGHLLFFASEAVLGRPLGPQAQEYGLRVGLIMVLILMVFATWQDINRIGIVDYFENLLS